jgi:hypothetical protein
MFERTKGRRRTACSRWLRLGMFVALAAGAAGGDVGPVLGPPVWNISRDGLLGNDYSYGVAIDSQGSVVTASTMAASPGSDGYLEKRLADGTFAWSDTVNNTASGATASKSTDSLLAVCVDKDDNVIAVGQWSGDYYGGDLYYNTVLVRKYTPQGALAWEWKGSSAYEAWSSARAVTTDAAGNVYVAGNAFMNWGADQNDWAIWKFDPDGNLQSGFPIIYNYSQLFTIADQAFAIAVDAEGSFVVAGCRGVSDNPDTTKRDVDWHVRKYHADRTLAWEQTYGGANLLADYARAVAIDAAGDVYVAGYTNVGVDNGAGLDWDGLVIKYAGDTGEPRWTQTLPTATGHHGVYYAATIGTGGQLFLAGTDGVIGASVTETRLELRSRTDGAILAEQTYAPGVNTGVWGLAQRGGFIALAGFTQGAADLDAFTAVYQAPAPPPTAQFVLPTKITRQVNAKNPAKSALTVTATLDTGPEAAAFDPTATISIGGIAVPISGLTPDKKGVLRYHDALNTFAIVPGASGSSRCTMTATLKGAQVLAVGADGSVDVTLSCGNVSAAGACTLQKGTFTLGHGALPSEVSVPRSASATLVGHGKDSFTVKWVTAPSEPATQMSDIVFKFGPTYSKTIPGASFKRRGTVWSFTDKTNALPAMTINTATGLITVTGKKADLGAFDMGAQAVRFVAGPAADPSTVDVRMVRKGRTLTY